MRCRYYFCIISFLFFISLVAGQNGQWQAGQNGQWQNITFIPDSTQISPNDIVPFPFKIILPFGIYSTLGVNNPYYLEMEIAFIDTVSTYTVKFDVSANGIFPDIVSKGKTIDDLIILRTISNGPQNGWIDTALECGIFSGVINTQVAVKYVRMNLFVPPTSITFTPDCGLVIPEYGRDGISLLGLTFIFIGTLALSCCCLCACVRAVRQSRCKYSGVLSNASNVELVVVDEFPQTWEHRFYPIPQNAQIMFR